MFDLKKRPVRGLVVAISLSTAASTAQAHGGDMTRSFVLGLIGGYAVDQYIHQQQAFGSETDVSPPIYEAQPMAPVYYQPSAPSVSAYAESSPDSRAFNGEDRRVRIEIQYNLMQSGFYNGALDGVWGPLTEEAVFHYARAHDQIAMLSTEEDARQLFATILR